MFALALFPAIASAQTREIKEEGKTVFKPHAYLQLQGGAAHTLGEVSFTDLISPAAAINLGYKFTPVLAHASVQAGGRPKAPGWLQNRFTILTICREILILLSTSFHCSADSIPCE